MFASADPLVAYLVTTAKGGTAITHEREHDTHGTLLLAAGNWRVVRQRERGPAGWQRVAD